MVFAFASCKKTEQNPQPDQTTTTTTETTTEDMGPTLSPSEAKATIIGTWIYDETISPQKFYGNYYNESITKTKVQMRTTYKFSENGSYSTSLTILNITDVRKEYRSLMVEGARIKAENSGKFLTTNDVVYYENYADKVLDDILKDTKGTYQIDGNKLIYSDSTTEVFAFKGNQLIIKGNSQDTGDYKIVFNRK